MSQNNNLGVPVDINPEIAQNMREEQEQRIHPEQYVMQTLDDAALVLTVCTMSLEQMTSMLPTQIRDVEYRVQHLKEMLEAIDNKVAQWYTSSMIVDSTLEGN